MRILGNLLWLVFSGIEMAIAYVVAGLLGFLLIVTIPFGAASFRLAGYTLWPFGRVVVRQPGAGTGSVVGNVLWFLIAGWWLAGLHVVFGLLLALTIIGLPFTVVHLKLAGLAVRPFGKQVVEVGQAAHHEVVLSPAPQLGSTPQLGPGPR